MGLLDELREHIIKATNESVIDEDGNVTVYLGRGIDLTSMIEVRGGEVNEV